MNDALLDQVEQLDAAAPGGTAPDAGVLASLNLGGRYRVASSVEMLAWATAGGRLVRLETEIGSPLPAGDAPDFALAVAVKSALKGFLLLLQRPDTAFDRNLPDRAALLAAVVARGVLTAQDLADLDAVTPRDPSPAARALGRDATADDLPGLRATVAKRLSYRARLTALSDWYQAEINRADAWRDGGYQGERPAVAPYAGE